MEFAYDWHDGLTTKLLADVESSISSEKTTYIHLIRTAARYRVAMRKKHTFVPILYNCEYQFDQKSNKFLM